MGKIMIQHFTIGRRDVGQADILIDSGTISGKHAELSILQNGELSIKDLGSRNGTSILRNGKQIPVIAQSMILQKSDKLILGGKEYSISALISSVGKAKPSSAPSSGTAKRYMRCPECGSITPYGHPCVECGFDGGGK
jgi:pSer/pThr/pTyr-binding forkhead associated (FHA) protein